MNFCNLFTGLGLFVFLVACQTAEITESASPPTDNYKSWSHYMGDPTRTH